MTHSLQIKNNLYRACLMFTFAVSLLVCGPNVAAATDQNTTQPATYILRYDALYHPVQSTNGMVASQNTLSSIIGARILEQGGNAVDAAVAMGFSLAVTLPRAGNLGGGGFMVVHMAAEGKTLTIDYRGSAPASASAEQFLNADGEVDFSRSKLGYTASTVPGTVAGLHEAHQRWGKLPWKTVLAPAIEQAKKGILVTRDLAWALNSKRAVLMQNSDSSRTYFKDSGAGYQPGELMRRPDLAWTLQQIADRGRDGFYRGKVAERIERAMRDHGGLITSADLKAYKALVKEPITTDYRGYTVATSPPPAGGTHLLQMLNILERYPLLDYGHNSADSLHLLAESMKRAYAYRAQYLGDPAFYPVPVARLIDKAFATEMADDIDLALATPVAQIEPRNGLELDEGPDTTHYSVMDAEGNAVSNTYTLSASFGSGVTIPGTGILMNNQINNFALRYGVAGATGANTSFANSLAPGKRTKSTQTPIIILRAGQPFLATGTPGGSRIITTMVQIVSNVIDHNMNLAEATYAPRIYHGWDKDELEYEPGISVDTLERLSERGHILQPGASMGSVQSVLWDGTTFSGAADPRRPGAMAIGVNSLKVSPKKSSE
jgi:gamma-glutamyltranspeptidase/glutathione hydrolase